MKANYIFKLALFLALSAAVSCSSRPKYVDIGGYAQGGIYNVRFNIRDASVSKNEIAVRIDSILTLVDTTLSGYNKASLLSRFNEGESIMPNSLFKDIYAYCHELYEETDGCVDVASGPLFDLWGFGFSNDSLPDAAAVKSAMASCGMARLKADIDLALDDSGRLDPRELLICPSVDATLPKLNFNAVAQGYTCDLVAEYLSSVGVKDMLVDIGEIYCAGKNPRGEGWSIGVDRPVDGNDSPGAMLDGIWNSEGRSCGIVTSGNYRKFYIRDGKKYAHTIDPRNGYPVEHHLLSASISASTAAASDAYATYCMVLGPEAAKEFILSRPDIEGYLISGSNEAMSEWASDGFSITLNR